MNINLRETFKKCKYKFSGHGNNTIEVLKESFKSIPSEIDADIYGEGHVIENFENKIANLLGKDSARFYPSGTMAQQNALRVHCDEVGISKVILHPLAHLEKREEYGLKYLHNIDSILVGDETRIYTLDDLKGIKERYSVVLLELPARDIGGEMPTWEELVAMSEYTKANNIRFHLDGARLWEAQPYYNRTLKEICSLFDSIYVSFYKGIGGVAGAILAGNSNFISQAKIWQRRYGGNLISLYPYVIPANYYLEKRLGNMSKYWDCAKDCAARLNKIDGVETFPLIPKSNLFHVHIYKNKKEIESALNFIYKKISVGITPALTKIGEKYKFEISMGDRYSSLSKIQLDEFFNLLEEKL